MGTTTNSYSNRTPFVASQVRRTYQGLSSRNHDPVSAGQTPTNVLYIETNQTGSQQCESQMTNRVTSSKYVSSRHALSDGKHSSVIMPLSAHHNPLSISSADEETSPDIKQLKRPTDVTLVSFG